MKYIIINLSVAVLLTPLIFWFGYTLGAFNQKTLDAPSKAFLVSKIAEYYENNDSRQATLLYTYIDTELSFYEEYVTNGLPVIANTFHHSHFIENADGRLRRIADFIHSENKPDNQYRRRIAARLDRLGYEKQQATMQ